MTFSKSLSIKLLLLTATLITACTAAKSPLGAGEGATFAIFPDRVTAKAELRGASKATYGRPKSQRLHFEVCLQSLATGQPVANGARFAIGDGTGTTIDRAASADGCLRWDEEHAVSPMAPERNLRVNRQILARENHRGTVNLSFNVKPWLEGGEAVQSALAQENYADAIDTAGTLNFTLAYPTSDGLVKATDLDTRTHFDVADNLVELTFTAISKNVDFEVDPFLNLSIPYRYNFSFAPRITRQVFSGALRSDAMSSGKVRVTFVFFAAAKGDFKSDDRYLTSTQVDAEVGANGRLSGALIVKYPHMLFASGSQTVLMQISSPDQKDVEARSFSGSVAVVDHRGALTITPDGRDAEKIHADATRERAERERARPTPLAQYLSTHDVLQTAVDELPVETTRAEDKSFFGQFAKRMVSREELRYALGAGEFDARGFTGGGGKGSVASRLCRAYLKMNPTLGYTSLIKDVKTDYVTAIRAGEETGIADIFCLKGNDQFVTIKRLDFVEKIVNPAPRNVYIHTYSNMDFALYYVNETVDHTTVAGGIQLGLRLGNEALGFGTDIGVSRARAFVSNNGGRFGKSQTLAVDVGQMEILASVRSCVEITGLKAPFITKPWLICDETPRPAAWIPEQFYYFSQMFGSNHSPFLNPFSAQSGVKFLIRGGARMADVTQRLQNTDLRDSGFDVLLNMKIKTHVPDLTEFDTLGKVDDLTEQEAPGAFER